MSNYTQITDFSVKDNLASGDAAKVIKGSDIDAELAAISTAIATKGEGGDVPSGSAMVFFQTAAPTGWTKSTTHNDKALRVVSGDGGGTGGSVAFETAFASKSVTGTVEDHTLSASQIPSHTHHVRGPSVNSATSPANYAAGNTTGTATGGMTGSFGGAHNHSFTGTAINLDVQYINVIVCTKD